MMGIETIQNLLFMNLVNRSPVLSGNMRMNIKCGMSTPTECQIVIEAPFYDLKEWKRSGVIKRTGETKNGKTDYAYWVNELGGFATHNKSEHWVNRAIYEIMTDAANQMGATLINELPL